MNNKQAEENYKKLVNLFPSIEKETIDEKGNIINYIDAKALSYEINAAVLNESYDFTWPGKEKAYQESLTSTTKTLRPYIYDNPNFFKTSNIYIEGDNIDALKILRKSYKKAIKMIYIDPPYNTQNDFIYKDKFFSKLQDYKNLYSEASSADKGRFHASWFNMIYPRLKIAKELLTEDGVIFISIDESEVSNLKTICNEIFGEDNFVNTFMWLHGKGKKDAWSRTLQQYILAYAKNKKKLESWKELKTCDYPFANPDNDPKGPWFNGSLSLAENRSNPNHKNFYKVTSPSGIEWERQWFLSKEEMDEKIKDGDIYFGQSPSFDKVPRIKLRPSSKVEVIPNNIIDDCNTSHGAEKHIKSLFGSKCFSYPKPYELIQKLMSFMNMDNQIVMDFFSGSATSAEAVMRYNVEHNTNTKYIMVQLPDNLDTIYEKAYRPTKVTVKNAIEYLDERCLPHNLCEIGKERIINSAKLIRRQNKNLRNDIDFSFRCFRIDSSNFDESILKKGRNSFDLIFQIIIEEGLPLDSKLKVIKSEDDYIYTVNGNDACMCFSQTLNEEAIETIAKLKTKVCVLMDKKAEEKYKKINSKTLLKYI